MTGTMSQDRRERGQQTRPCVACGKLTTKNLPHRKRWLCIECAIARAVSWNERIREQARAARL